MVLHRLGYSRHGLKLTEQALEIVQGYDRLVESQVLSHLAAISLERGEPKRALELLEQALLLDREVENKTGKATLLNNIAKVYHAMGQPERALELYGQALLLMREVGDRRGAAVPLINMAGIYRTTGQPERALELFEQALPLIREAGDRVGEAILLGSSGGAYYVMGQPEKALELLVQALPILREVGARTEEAKLLANMARVYRKMGQPERALELFEQALLLMDKVGERAEEIATMSDMALLLYKYMKRRQDAIVVMQQAILTLDETDLSQDASGHTRDRLEQYLDAMYRGVAPEQIDQTAMPVAQLQMIVHSTVAVMTTMQKHRAEWHKTLTETLQDVRRQGVDRQIDVDLYIAVLALLDGQIPSLPDDHFYTDALTRIQAGIAAAGVQDDELFPTAESSERLGETIVSNTLAVLGSRRERLSEWRMALLDLKEQIAQADEQQLVALLDAIVDLLDAGGNPAGLGADLAGDYAQVWQALVEALGK